MVHANMDDETNLQMPNKFSLEAQATNSSGTHYIHYVPDRPEHVNKIQEKNFRTRWKHS